MTSQDFYNNLLNEGKQQPQPGKPAVATTNTSDSDREQELITMLHQSKTDITNGNNDWLKVGFALAGDFGESGRSYFHDISSIYSGYDAREAHKKYDECLRSESGRTDIPTLFYLAKQAGASVPKHQYTPTQATKGHRDKNVPVSLSTEEDEAAMPDFPLLPSTV